MKAAPFPENEQARIASLKEHKILDTEAEGAYDDLTKIASEICQTPIALVSLVDSERQWFKSRVGLDAPETHRDLAFCAHAILNPELFIVNDTFEDERFFDSPLVTGDPKIRFYAGTPLHTEEGLALGTLCVIDREPRDLTKGQAEALAALGRQVEAQLRLRLNITRLEKLNRIKELLLRMVSHDLKNSFNTIIGLSKVLGVKIDSLSKDNIRDVIKQIESSGQRANDLLLAMLEWSKSQAESQSAIKDEINIKKTIEEVTTSIEDLLTQKDVTFSIDCPEEITIHSNKSLLTSALQNLISNAIKFSNANDSVELRVTRTEKSVIIEVSDNGVGMKKEVAEKLFNQDEIFSTKGTQGEDGTGIGTLLIKDFVSSQGGKVFVDSTPGKGTRISLELPDVRVHS